MFAVGVVEYQPLSQDPGEKYEHYISRNLKEYEKISCVASKEVIQPINLRSIDLWNDLVTPRD